MLKLGTSENLKKKICLAVCKFEEAKNLNMFKMSVFHSLRTFPANSIFIGEGILSLAIELLFIIFEIKTVGVLERAAYMAL